MNRGELSAFRYLGTLGAFQDVLRLPRHSLNAWVKEKHQKYLRDSNDNNICSQHHNQKMD